MSYYVGVHIDGTRCHGPDLAELQRLVADPARIHLADESFRATMGEGDLSGYTTLAQRRVEEEKEREVEVLIEEEMRRLAINGLLARSDLNNEIREILLRKRSR